MDNNDNNNSSGSSSNDKPLTTVRRKIERELAFKEEENHRRLRAIRLDIARNGLAAHKNHQFGEAVRNFNRYLAILEELHKSGPGGLLPSHFDSQRDQPELLMISGIYWDLVKLYDRTKSDAKFSEFRHYLQKYLIFSKNMPYQALCAEAVRRYIANGRPVHLSDFRAVHKELNPHFCFVATSLVDVLDEPTMPRLQAFKNRVLVRNRMGRAGVLVYYQIGPYLATIIDQLPQPQRKLIGKCLDRTAVILESLYK